MKRGYLRIAIIYVAVSILWVTFSDKLLFLFHGKVSLPVFYYISSAKGYLYVLFTGVLIYKLTKASETRFAASEDQYRTMYENNNIPMWIYDLETLKFTSVNDAAVEAYGYSREQFANMTILDIRPQMYANKVKQAVSEISTKFKQGGVWIHKKADGNYIYVLISLHRIRYNNRKQVMVVAQNVTEQAVTRRKMERLNTALADEKQKLSETQQLAKVAGWEFYPGTKKLVWSDEIYNVINTPADGSKSLNELYAEHIPPHDRWVMARALGRLISTGQMMDVTLHSLCTGGGSHFLRVMARLEYKYDKPYKVVGFVQDITELKTLEQERNRYLLSLDDALNNMTESFYALSKEMVITKANQKFQAESGKSSAELIGKRFVDVFPGIESRITYQEFTKALNETRPVKFEAYSRSMQQWLSMAAYPTTEGLAVYFTDITAQKEKDFKLREALERYELVVKATQDVIYDYDIGHDRLLFNNSKTRWLHYAPHQVGTNFQWWLSIIHFEDQVAYLNSQQKAIDNRQETWRHAYRIDCGNGSYKFVDEQAYILYNEQNEPVRITGAVKDIDALKRYNEENRRLADIITKVNNMVITVDAADRISWANKAFEDYTGCRSDQLMGRRPKDVLHVPPSHNSTVDYIIACKHQLKTFSVEIMHNVKKREHWVSVEFTPMFDGTGKHTGYIAVHQDITARKLREEHIRLKNEALQQIAWLSSHELRRPVASILGLSYLYNDAETQQEKDDIQYRVQQSASELDSMIIDITKRIDQHSDVGHPNMEGHSITEV